MEVLFKKIYAISHDITEILKIYNYGRYLHSVSDCHFENCTVDQYLYTLHRFVKGDKLRLNFIDVSAKHLTVFMVIDQVKKKLGDEVFKMKNENVIKHINSEFHKVACFVEEVLKHDDAVNKIIGMENTFL